MLIRSPLQPNSNYGVCTSEGTAKEKDGTFMALLLHNSWLRRSAAISTMCMMQSFPVIDVFNWTRNELCAIFSFSVLLEPNKGQMDVVTQDELALISVTDNVL